MVDADVVVIGAGIVGAATVRELVARGKGVVLLEQYERAHHRGSSHGATRIYRQAYDADDYVSLAGRTMRGWRQLEADSGTAVLTQTGAVDHGSQAHLEALAAALHRAGEPFEFMEAAQAERRWPGLRFAGRVLVHENAGRVSAAGAIEAMLSLATHGGADLRFNTPVREIVPSADGVTVRTDTDEVRAKQVVVAAGSWAPALAGSLIAGGGKQIPRLRITQEQPAHFPSALPDSAWPSFIHTEDRTTSVYGLLTPGEGVKVGFHGTGPELSRADERSFTPEPKSAIALQEYVAEWVPGVDATRPEFISCLYDNTPTDDFVIDRVGNVTIATGFSGHGFKFGPALGALIADLTDGRATLARFALRAA